MRSRTRIVLAVGAAVLLLVLAVAVVTRNNAQQSVAPPTTGPTGPPPTLPGGASAFDLRRPFAPEVAWNRPVSELGRSTEYAEYAERFWKYSNYGAWNDPTQRDDIYIQFRDYSTPIYDARTATGTKRAYFADFGYPPEPGYSIEIPWNESWREANGSDAMILMANPDTGEHWVVWAYQRNNPSTCLGLANLASGFTPFSDICVGGASKLVNEDGTVADYRTWNSTQNGRGMGIPKLALVTTPYEVRAGVIEHALEMTVFNTMFGPPCDAAQMATDAAGSTCGFYVPPATRIEWFDKAPTDCGANNQPSTPAYRQKTVPEGMRFALDVSDEDIEAWLTERGYAEPLRSTARVFAVALRDYGWVIAETGCYGTSIEVDGMVNPDAKAIWESLGVVDTPEAGSMLRGLFTQDRIYVVNPSQPFPSIHPTNPGLRR